MESYSGLIFEALVNMDAESLIRYGGLLIVCLLVFCSTGLFFCFFIPIGIVLFTTGLFTATGDLPQNIFSVCSLLILSSVAGSLTGFRIGRSTGKYFYTRKDSRFFRRKYLIATEKFYKKYGMIAIIAGYFLPVIRTFSPVVAGVVKVKFRYFIINIILGSMVFILVFVLTGYLIGNLPGLRKWLKYIIPVFILIVTIPLIVKMVKEIKKSGNSNE